MLIIKPGSPVDSLLRRYERFPKLNDSLKRLDGTLGKKVVKDVTPDEPQVRRSKRLELLQAEQKHVAKKPFLDSLTTFSRTNQQLVTNYLKTPEGRQEYVERYLIPMMRDAKLDPKTFLGKPSKTGRPYSVGSKNWESAAKLKSGIPPKSKSPSAGRTPLHKLCLKKARPNADNMWMSLTPLQDAFPFPLSSGWAKLRCQSVGAHPAHVARPCWPAERHA